MREGNGEDVFFFFLFLRKFESKTTVSGLRIYTTFLFTIKRAWYIIERDKITNYNDMSAYHFNLS